MVLFETRWQKTLQEGNPGGINRERGGEVGGCKMMDAETLEDLIYKILTEEFYLGVAMSSNIARAIIKKVKEEEK